MNYTLITGASGGIGYELARQFAAAGHALILVARNAEKLAQRQKTLQADFGVAVETVSCDLTAPDAPAALFAHTRERQWTVDILVNNAGYGDFSCFVDSPWERQRDMVALNVTALMHLTHLYAGTMRTQGGGRILNVASVAAMGAGPYMAVYYAGKAFVLSFSEAMSEELRPFGISVTALCPGPTRTNFEAAAGLQAGNMFKKVRVELAEKVARRGYRATMKGKAVQYCGFTVWWMSLAARVAPRWFQRKFAKSVNGIPPVKESVV